MVIISPWRRRGIGQATGTFVTKAMLMHSRPYQKRRRPICMGTVAGCQLPGIRRPVRAAAQRSPRRSSMHCCRGLTLNGLLALCIVTFLPLLIPPISAAAAGELPQPDTAHCMGDKENPGKFGCAEAGWTSGAIPRNLGVRQRVEGSEAEKRMIIMTMVKTERYYDEEVPLMPKDVQENCINRDSLCAYWASLGDCDTNRQYMVDTCPAACQLCWLAGTDLLH